MARIRLEASRNAHDRVLAAFSKNLERMGARPEAMILKVSMVLPGADSSADATVERVATETLAVLRRRRAASVAGIAFLSGGQSDERATLHLDAMNRQSGNRPAAVAAHFFVRSRVAASRFGPLARRPCERRGCPGRVTGSCRRPMRPASRGRYAEVRRRRLTGRDLPRRIERRGRR